MIRFLASLMIVSHSGNLLARGRSYCDSDACGENALFLAYWLGFVGIFFIIYGNQRVKKAPKISFFIGWFAAALLSMLVALIFQAEVLNLRNGFGMVIVAITGYSVFWYGISRSRRKF